MSELAGRAWRFYVTDMIGFSEKVMLYTDGLDMDRFVASGLNYARYRAQPAPDWRGRDTCSEARAGICGRYRLAADHRHAQSLDPWLSGYQEWILWDIIQNKSPC